MKRGEDTNKQYQTFEHLEVYQVAREFRKAMYRVARKLPDIEKFELAPQIRDAAISLTNNIAEVTDAFIFSINLNLYSNPAAHLRNCSMI